MATVAAGRLLTLDQVADHLALSQQGVRRLIRRGVLPAVDIAPGSRPMWRVHPKDLDAWIQQRRRE